MIRQPARTNDERSGLRELTWPADGPAPWRAMLVFAPAWLAVTWAAANFLGPGPTAFAVIAGVLCFWLLVRKAPAARPLPGWTILPLAIAFVAGAFAAGYMATFDRDLLAAGYGLWFVLWLQFGLWLKDRYGRSGP
jgi:hypothetical protein